MFQAPHRPTSTTYQFICIWRKCRKMNLPSVQFATTFRQILMYSVQYINMSTTPKKDFKMSFFEFIIKWCCVIHWAKLFVGSKVSSLINHQSGGVPPYIYEILRNHAMTWHGVRLLHNYVVYAVQLMIESPVAGWEHDFSTGEPYPHS